MITNVLCNKKTKRFCTFLHMYVFYVCAPFHCIWRSRFKVICTLVSALKSKMAAISMETKRGKKFVCFFLHIFYTDHNKCKMKWVDWKWAKQFFDQHLPLTGPRNGSYTLDQVILARKLQSSCTTRTKSALTILRTASTWTRPTRHWCHTQFRSILYEGWDNKIVLE